MRLLRRSLAAAPALLVLLLAGRAVGAEPAASEPGDPCAGASKKIQAVAAADQDDRKDWDKHTVEEMRQIAARDAERRRAIRALADRGCLRSADDYHHAALVYQHGDAPDDYLQTYRWSLRAAELGDKGSPSLAAAAVDRWLMTKGYKQVYASQARGYPPTWCYCLWPVEASATDDDRRKMRRPTTAEQLEWIDRINEGKSCPPAAQCQVEAKPVPKGSMPDLGW